jgi:hypothetical protein
VRTRTGILLSLVATILLCLVGRQACATQIQGNINFGGVVTFDTMSLATATTVDLWNLSYVLQRQGDFIPYTSFQQSVTMSSSPWVFDPSAALPSFWMVGGFTFDLTSAVVVTQSNFFLNIQATGTLTGNGFDPTPAIYSFTASRADGGNANTFSFQSTTTAVPEAGATALFAIGALAVGLSRSHRRRPRTATARSR